MATVFDVAAYILNRCGAMSAMKLQKLLFYSQAMSLVWDDVPLFDEEFEAWAKGPVCRELFNAHKGRFWLDNVDFLLPYGADKNNLSSVQQETVNVVTDDLKDLSPLQLSNMTHSESPWQEARRGCNAGEYCNNIISKETMQEYYTENW